MPKWEENFKPDSFLGIIQKNNSIRAHSLILIDIGLDFKDALNQLETAAKNNTVKRRKVTTR